MHFGFIVLFYIWEPWDVCWFSSDFHKMSIANHLLTKWNWMLWLVTDLRKTSWNSFIRVLKHHAIGSAVPNCEKAELRTTFLKLSLDSSYSIDFKKSLTFENTKFNSILSTISKLFYISRSITVKSLHESFFHKTTYKVNKVVSK